MKKIIVVVLVIMMMFSMGGCSKEEIKMWDSVVDIFREDKTEKLPYKLPESITSSKI